ncbi:ATP-binding cassette sub-family C member 9-like [Amphiura filiformis]|uniref:ATP-binding cassette sub-family C member 9-like n=1 Tax=Amphiura filiformis TaxID=82378 RepID=UPI003B22261D
MSSTYWEWFCGHEDDNYDNSTRITDDTCVVNATAALLHILFILISSCILIFCSFVTYRHTTCFHLYKFPAHTFRWFFLLVFLFLCVLSIGEGILTDLSFQQMSSTRPQLYLPAVFTTLGAVFSLIFYHNCECWRALRLLNILLLYWILGVVVEAFKLRNFHVSESAGVDIARYDVAIINLLVYITLAILEIFLQCSTSSKISLSEEEPSVDMKYCEDYVNCVSFGLFYWIRWLLNLGYKRPLVMKDLGALPRKHQTKYNYQKLRKVFRREMESANEAGREPSLWKVYFKTFPGMLFKAFLAKLFADFVLYLEPICLYVITEQVTAISLDTSPHFVTISEFFTNVYILCLIFVTAPLCNSLAHQVHYYFNACIGVHLRSAMQALVYEKSLRIYNLAGGDLTMGEITNHMSTDAMNLHYFCEKMHLVWSVPTELVCVVIILYFFVGWTAIIGFISVLLLFPLQLVIIGHITKHQTQTQKKSDVRLKRSNEMLQGIKLLKLYGWGEEFRERILSARNDELKSLYKLDIQFGNIIAICFTGTGIITLVLFATYPYITGNDITPSLAFTVIVLVNLLVDPLYQFPTVLSTLVNAVVATRRLTKFFTHSEIETSADTTSQSEESSSLRVAFQNGSTSKGFKFNWKRRWKGFSSGEEDETTPLMMTKHKTHTGFAHSGISAIEADPTVIKVSEGCFTWDGGSKTSIIKDINIGIEKGKLIMVVGAVGSGKSSLLSAIIGEMTTLRGTVFVNNENNGVAYSAQTAWIVNASLQENILFGKPYNKTRYKQVIDACALQQDIDILPAGDSTEIGEKGINLSGGQKQRVSVARAMYSEKEIVLLDDPLSALDVHVGGHLFKEGIIGILIKEGNTVVLVTHQLQFLQYADKVLVMQHGVIVHDGTFDEVSSSDPTLFASWKQSLVEMSESEASGSESDVMEERNALIKQVHQKVLGKGVKKDYSNDQALNFDGQLTQDEELERGSVSFRVYKYLVKSMGWPIVITYFIFRLALEGCSLGKVFWLALWSEAGENLNVTANSTMEVDNLYYIAVYGWLSLGLLASTFFMAMAGVTAMFIAAKNIHSEMIRNIFGSPLRFFDTTPVGRTMNRLSSDTHIVDIKLLVTLFSLSFFIVSLPSFLIAIAAVQPIFLLEMIPVAIAFWLIYKQFIASSRELQRLNSITKSPVFAHFSETLGGLSTIRAYKAQERLFNELLQRIDVNNTAFLYLSACNGWMGNRVVFVSATLMLMASITSVVMAETGRLNVSYVGLVLSYAFTLPYMLWCTIRFSADTEILMNAVERIQYYTELPNEPKGGKEPASSWPHRGEIKMEDIHVRYATDLPCVLRAVNLYIKPGEKVGICGRTGSGKSSLTLTLFRVIDTYKGRIVIDGEDIASLPLRTLRRRLSIIPQEPILFTGTIRDNIDPEGSKSDKELWDALESAQLGNVVSQLDAGLDYEVSEGGENFSVGQRQLFCLVRAFLRNSRILIMDEATASIDYDTESILQDAVKSIFFDKTVITIAHRVSTILKSDTIVVLNEGEIAEYDTPENLLANDSSIFASLVQANK